MEKLPHDVLYAIIPYAEKIMPFLGIRDDIDNFIYKIDHKRKVSKMNAEFKEFHKVYFVEEEERCTRCNNVRGDPRLFSRGEALIEACHICFPEYYQRCIGFTKGRLIGSDIRRVFKNKPYYIRRSFRKYLKIYRVGGSCRVLAWILVVYNNFKDHLKGLLTREEIDNISRDGDIGKVRVSFGRYYLPNVKGMDFNYNKIEL